MPTIKNLKKTAERIRRAIKNKEKIIIFSDADLDGICSAIILQETIFSLGGKPTLVYFPDREKEGYGLNDKSLKFLRKFAPAVLFVLDCGIGNFSETSVANSLGFEVVIIDHHEILDKLPEASLIIDPKQKNDSYPFKKMTTAALTYCLFLEIFKNNPPSFLNQSFQELSGISVVADMMPLQDVNQQVLKAALRTIKSSLRNGIDVLVKMIEEDSDTSKDIIRKMVAILNITKINNNLPDCYLLLSVSDGVLLKKLARKLIDESLQRNQEIERISGLVLQDWQKNGEDLFIFEGSSHWPQYLTGAVASRVCNKTHKPTFIFKKDKTFSRGSVRTPREINAVVALSECKKCLSMYGGHPPAAGFSLKNENIEKLKTCLGAYFKQLD